MEIQREGGRMAPMRRWMGRTSRTVERVVEHVDKGTQRLLLDARVLLPLHKAGRGVDVLSALFLCLLAYSALVHTRRSGSLETFRTLVYADRMGICSKDERIAKTIATQPCCSGPQVSESDMFSLGVGGVVYVAPDLEELVTSDSLVSRTAEFATKLRALSLDELFICVSCRPASAVPSRHAPSAEHDTCASHFVQNLQLVFSKSKHMILVRPGLTRSECYNTALRVSQLDMLLVLDASDRFLPSLAWVEEAQALLERDPDVGAVSSSVGFLVSGHKSLELFGEHCLSSPLLTCLCTSRDVRYIPYMQGKVSLAYVDVVPVSSSLLRTRAIPSSGFPVHASTIGKRKGISRRTSVLLEGIETDVNISLQMATSGYQLAVLGIAQDKRSMNTSFLRTEFLLECRDSPFAQLAEQTILQRRNMPHWQSFHDLLIVKNDRTCAGRFRANLASR
ncbi:hypothetical protein FVE85_1606 [Porphyridium purpureum]|uniref:Uncharacterized protein n=1 Tax=Porphyridium purpureum TaxID=35688 RepID=A0A5J4YVB9_PORPP|nr:hypothetical protein FVE85_1606 [Porphyridium purpureum]|eukprot:POR7590..scf209_3